MLTRIGDTAVDLDWVWEAVQLTSDDKTRRLDLDDLRRHREESEQRRRSRKPIPRVELAPTGRAVDRVRSTSLQLSVVFWTISARRNRSIISRKTQLPAHRT